MKEKISKIYFGVLSLVVFVIVLLDVYLSATNQYGLYQHAWQRTLNTLVFFTILSNVMVGITSFILFRGKSIDNIKVHVIQFCSFLCILVTGVVYHIMLAPDLNPTGMDAVTNFFLHTFIPIAYVLGWLFLIPRGSVNAKVLTYSLALPLGWLAFTLIKGPFVGFYPYPFMDVNYLGYLTALINVVVIFVAAFILAMSLKYVDNWLSRRIRQ